MSVANIRVDDIRLSELVEKVERGEEVVIARGGRPVARLVPYREGEPSGQRRGGQWRGRVRIAPDFDELPPDVAASFGLEPE